MYFSNRSPEFRSKNSSFLTFPSSGFIELFFNNLDFYIDKLIVPLLFNVYSIFSNCNGGFIGGNKKSFFFSIFIGDKSSILLNKSSKKSS